jgi:hypothetical protein
MTPRLILLRDRLLSWGRRTFPAASALLLRPWITCLSLGFVLAALVANGSGLLQLSLDGQGWLWLVLGVGVSGCSLLVGGWAWGVAMAWRLLLPRWPAVVALHASSNLRKYLPGGIWHLATRVQVLRGPRSPLRGQPAGTAQALVVTLLDPLLAAVAALALVPLGGWQNGLALLCLMPLLLLFPQGLEPLLLRLERQRAQQLGLDHDLQQEIDLQGQAQPDRETEPGFCVQRKAIYPLGPLLAQLAFVLLRFAAFLCCVWAFDLQLSLGAVSWLSAFALAWTAGLVVPGAPGGLGVFEAVLLLRLSSELPQPSLLAVALSYRLIVTLADGLVAALIGLDLRLERSGTSSQ